MKKWQGRINDGVGNFLDYTFTPVAEWQNWKRKLFVLTFPVSFFVMMIARALALILAGITIFLEGTLTVLIPGFYYLSIFIIFLPFILYAAGQGMIDYLKEVWYGIH